MLILCEQAELQPCGTRIVHLFNLMMNHNINVQHLYWWRSFYLLASHCGMETPPRQEGRLSRGSSKWLRGSSGVISLPLTTRTVNDAESEPTAPQETLTTLPTSFSGASKSAINLRKKRANSLPTLFYNSFLPATVRLLANKPTTIGPCAMMTTPLLCAKTICGLS